MADKPSIIKCSTCQSRFDVSNFKPGQKFLCKKCKNLVVVPDKDLGPETEVTLPYFESTPATGQTGYVGSASEFERALQKEVIGGCRLERLLGRGGMGAVFLGRQISLDRPVAVKILPSSFAQNTDHVSRFEVEARAVAKLNHPNIIQVYDMGQDEEGTYFIVMEFVEGHTLSALLKEKGKFNEKTAVGAIIQACSGMQAAHDAEILHRDLKPENLMLDNKGRIKIADFGLAKHVQGSVRLTGTGIALGTPAFMAPEQGMGETVDSRADIYSLGGTLFTLLAGRLPFEADSPLSMMMKHATEAVPEVTAFEPTVSKSVEKVILRAMEKSPGDRYDTCEVMRKALISARRKGRTEARKIAEGVLEPLPEEEKSAPAPRTPTPPKTAKSKTASPGRGTKAPTPGTRGTKVPTPGTRGTRVPTPGTRGTKVPTPGAKGVKAPTPGRGRKTSKEEAPKLRPAAKGKAPRSPTPEKVRAVREEKPRPRDTGAARKRKGPPSAAKKKKSPAPLIFGVVALLLLVGAVAVVAVVLSNQPSPTEPDTGPSDGDSGKAPDEDDGGKGPGPSPGEGDPKKIDDTGPKPPFLPDYIKETKTRGEYLNTRDQSVLLWVPGGEAEIGIGEEDVSAIIDWFLSPVYFHYRQLQPLRRVRLRGFFIGKHEVSNQQYDKFVEWSRTADEESRSKVSHPHEPLGKNYKQRFSAEIRYSIPRLPVVGVDWFDAYAYARWAGMDLPTEAQWEKAALWDPVKKERRRFPWGKDPSATNAQVADSFAGKVFRSSHEYTQWFRFGRGEEKAKMRMHTESGGDLSPIGAVNMAGNVSEWVKDYYNPWFSRYPDAKMEDPYNNVFSYMRTIRGGNYHSPLERYFRRWGRTTEEGESRFTDLGFRCVLNLTESTLVDEGRGVTDEKDLRKFDPNRARRVLVGNIEYRLSLEQHDTGATLAQVGLAKFPDAWEFPYLLGVALQRQAAEERAEARRKELYRDAAAQFRTAAEKDPLKERKARSHYQRGFCHRKAGDYPTALEDFNRSLTIDPNQFDAYFERGHLHYWNLEKPKEALTDFRKALSYDESDADGWYMVGRTQEKLGDIEGAVKALDNCLILRDAARNALYLRGALLLKLDREADALNDFEELVREEHLLHGNLGLAKIYFKKGDWARARAACVAAMSEYPVKDEDLYQEARKLYEEVEKKLK
jgi:serine/threonine-protein kinase